MKKNTPYHEPLAGEQNDFELFELIKLYQEHSTELPNSDIDKQILATAERELASTKLKGLTPVPWWKRLFLPLYVAATFTFTALAVHWFWPASVKVPPGTSIGTVAVEVMPKVSVNRVTRFNYPDKEIWAKQIVELIKKNDDETAQKELTRFKNIYPNYPIDKQIQAFRQ